MTPMFDEQELKKVKHVALFMSGGVDSTLLFWRLANLSVQNRFKLTLLTARNTMNYEWNVHRILQSEFTPKNLDYHWFAGYHGGRDDGNIDAAIYDAYVNHREPFELIFTGVTKNPPGLVHAHAPDRVSPDHVKAFGRMRCPFVDKTKDYVFKQYLDNNLLGLYALTHSCTGQKKGECGTCFQCKEKLWSEAQNGYVRPT